ncbi:MAG TPA: glycosyltransferase [Bacteroidia bacterium]|nr:glycosyltransferase [Bacteroidia bacterium]
MKSGKHILLLIPGFPANEQDDTCFPPVQVMLEQFRKQEPDFYFSVVTVRYPFTTKKYQWKGMDVYPCNGGGKKGFARILGWWRVMGLFKKIHGSNPVDLVHSFWFTECVMLGEWLHAKYAVPHINTLMGQDALDGNKYLHRKNLQKVPVIVLSERHAAAFQKSCGRLPAALVGWGTENFSNAGKQKEYDVIVAGSLIPVKRPFLAIEAAKQLVQKNPGFKMGIAGDGPLRKELNRQVLQSGLESHVFFAGACSRMEVISLMQKSRVLLHTSSYESFGFVFAEALECNIPIVSFAVGIAEESDYWSVVKNAEEIPPAIEKFLGEPPSKAAFATFPVSATVNAYAELYRKYAS